MKDRFIEERISKLGNNTNMACLSTPIFSAFNFEIKIIFTISFGKRRGLSGKFDFSPMKDLR